MELESEEETLGILRKDLTSFISILPGELLIELKHYRIYAQFAYAPIYAIQSAQTLEEALENLRELEAQQKYTLYFQNPKIVDKFMYTLAIKFQKSPRDIVEKFEMDWALDWYYKILPMQEALCEATDEGNLEKIKQLLAQDKTNINALSTANFTPLILAVCKGYGAIVQYLLEQGADVNTQAIGGCTPLHFATIGESPEIVRLLLEHGADPWIVNKFGQTMLDRVLHISNRAQAEICNILNTVKVTPKLKM